MLNLFVSDEKFFLVLIKKIYMFLYVFGATRKISQRKYFLQAMKTRKMDFGRIVLHFLWVEKFQDH